MCFDGMFRLISESRLFQPAISQRQSVQWAGRRCCAAGEGRAAARPGRSGFMPIVIEKWHHNSIRRASGSTLTGWLTLALRARPAAQRRCEATFSDMVLASGTVCRSEVSTWLVVNSCFS